MIDHDQLFKELLTTFFVEFIEMFLTRIVGYLDPTSFTLLDKELFGDWGDGKKHEADIVVKAKFLGKETFFLILVETQSYAQQDFNHRLFRYFSKLYEVYNLPIYPVAIFSYEKPLRAEPSNFKVTFPDLTVLEFNYRSIQLNRLNWRDYLQCANPVATALMAKMKIKPAERPKVKLECLRLLASLRLDRAKMRLISRFIDTYLRLNAAELKLFQQEMEQTLSLNEKEAVMEISTSWKEEGLQEGLLQGISQGISQGKREECLTLISRMLEKRVGEVSLSVKTKIGSLPLERLEDLAIDLLDFNSSSDLDLWLNKDGRDK